jgi:hypothetical protein
MSDQFGLIAAGVENLNSVVAGIRNPNMIIRINGERPRLDELAWFFAVTAPLKDENAFGGKLLHPVIVAIFTDVVVSVRIPHDIGDKREFAWGMPADSSDGPILQEFSQRRVDQHAEIMRVGDKQISISIKRQTTGLAGIDLRRTPSVEKFAVSVKNLNSPGRIHDVQLVFIVNRHRSGLLHATVAQPTASPDFLQSPCTAADTITSGHNQGDPDEK